MRKITYLLGLMLLLLAACGGGDAAGPDQTTDNDGTPPTTVPADDDLTGKPLPEDWQEGPVFDLESQLQILESLPIQVRLEVSGNLPTPCHEPFWTITDDGETLAVDLVSGQSPEVDACAEVLEPFEVQIDLGSWQDASRTVTLNGEVVGEFTS